MERVLESSRIPLSLVPEELIATAARDEGIKLEELKPTRDGDYVVLTKAKDFNRVLAKAITDWWTKIPRWTRLNFNMQQQQQTQWCWAATSVSVALYYRFWSGWTQCEMVNEERGQTTCCQNGSSTACNQPNVLDSPLDRADVLDHMVSGTVSYEDIRTEIDSGRPLAWRIGWSGGGGHFAVIEGYQRFGTERVAIDDPWYGQSDVNVSVLTGGTYQGSGSWTHSYFTKRQPFGFPWFELEEVRFPWPIWERITPEEEVVGQGGERR